MGASETAKLVAKCAACGQLVKTWIQWFTEDCPALAAGPSPYDGHLLIWAERTALIYEKETQ